MKKVITYGTFDVFHVGHLTLLTRARARGDYLIVGVTTENYDRYRGKMNVHDSLMQRIRNVQATGLADEIIIEEYEGQKIDDIQKLGADIFAIGSDWIGKFDYLNEYCQVVYLERTKGVSSTQIRADQTESLRMGIIGTGRIAGRFLLESKYVSGIEVDCVYNPRAVSAQAFCQKYELSAWYDELDPFLEAVDAVYVASPHGTHGEYCRRALEKGKHVLCEKPMAMDLQTVKELQSIAKENQAVLLEAVKTAFCPGFLHLVSLAKSGVIGEIKDVEATFTKLVKAPCRELDPNMDGGSFNELASYVLLPVVKLLGSEPMHMQFSAWAPKDVDLFVKGFFQYPKATASVKTGIGVKSEGELIVSGTKGYLYVPAPWWKTSYFEVRFEDLNLTQKYFYPFDGDGLRYEINEFLHLISQKGEKESYKLSGADSLAMAAIFDAFHKKENVTGF